MISTGGELIIGGSNVIVAAEERAVNCTEAPPAKYSLLLAHTPIL
jgi:hypothetical protein